MTKKLESVVLGDVELTNVTHLYVDEARKLSIHRWPGGNGDLVQDLGAATAVVRVAGAAFGPNAGDMLEKLRKAMQGGKPLDFTASAAIGSEIDQVLISRLEVGQPPGLVDYYEFRLELLRYVPPPPAGAGFDPGALAAINADVAAGALANVTDVTGRLGSVADAVSAFDKAADMLAEAKDLVGSVEGMAELTKLVKALGGAAAASAKK
jgi:hypothetical protein